MRVLVTGANGRVGRAVVEELANDGHEVVGFDMTAPTRPKAGVEYIQGLFEDTAAVEKAATGVEAVIHLGAFMSWAETDVPKLFEANVRGTFNLLQAIAHKGIRRFVLASSGEVYPESQAQYLPVDEHHPKEPTTHYGMTKLMSEDMVWFYSRRYEIPSVILRFSHTQDATELLNPDSFFSGPRFFLNSKIRRMREWGNQAALSVLEPLYDGAEKLLVSRGEDGTPYRMCICDTRDLTQGIVLALEAEQAVGKAIGIGPDEAVSFDEAILLMQEATGLPVVEARLPGPAVNYTTSNLLAREVLGFRPQYDFGRMLQEAALEWNKRRS